MVFTYEVIELQRYQLIIDTRDVQSKQMEVLLLHTRGVLQMLGSLFMQATRQPPPARMQKLHQTKVGLSVVNSLLDVSLRNSGSIQKISGQDNGV